MEFLNLLLRAESGEDVSQIFRQNPNYKTINIVAPFSHQSNLPNLEINEFRIVDHIHIRHLVTLKRVFKAFGNLILSIKVMQYTHFDQDFYAYADLIIEHSSDTLENLLLHIEDKAKNFFDRVQKPFPKLKTLYLKGSFKTFNSPSHTFAELFPMVNQLQLVHADVIDADSIESKVENLKKLSLIFSSASAGQRIKENYKKFVKKNQNVRALQLTRCEHSFVEFIADNLRQLEQIEIVWSHFNNPDKKNNNLTDIHFDNVKSLTIKSTRPDRANPPQKIFFTNAIELVVNAYRDSDTLWTQFIAKLMSLEKLKFLQDPIPDDTLRSLIPTAKNLTVFSSELTKDVNDETILEFLKNHPNLLNGHFTRNDNNFSSAAELIRREFGDKWQLIEISKSSSPFELILLRIK